MENEYYKDHVLRNIVLSLGTIPTTGATSATVVVPMDASLVGAELSTKSVLAASDTNYLTFTLTNKGQDGTGSTAMLGTADTKVTGGAAVASYTAYALAINATAANLAVNANDCLELTITATGTLANTLLESTIRLDFMS